MVFKSEIHWHSALTPPDDAVHVLAVVRDYDDRTTLQTVIYYNDASESNGPLWVISEGCSSGEEYDASHILGWADQGEVARLAVQAAESRIETAEPPSHVL